MEAGSGLCLCFIFFAHYNSWEIGSQIRKLFEVGANHKSFEISKWPIQRRVIYAVIAPVTKTKPELELRNGSRFREKEADILTVVQA